MARPIRDERRPRPHVHPLLRHLGPLALAAVLVASAAPAPTYGAAMTVTPTAYRPKDFAFLKKDGVYHLFYIRHNDFLPQWATEIDFGHAISTDLFHWAQLPAVMPLDPNGWDNLHVWAPHIVQSDGLWWMFYTGVTDRPGTFHDTQRIGAAVSSDLMTWNRVHQTSVWSTDSAPWAWWAPLSPGMSCRDPFVMPDPAAPGQWLLYYTATPANDTLSTLVGVARSPDADPGAWQDEKPLWITHRSLTFNSSTESPHLFEHNGRWFLFITSNAGQPLTFFVGSNPLGEPATWTYRGRLRNMLGYDTSTWFASESLRDGTQDLFAFASLNRIEIRRIVWGVGDNFTLAEPSVFHMVSMDWTRASARENQYVGLRLKAANGFAFEGELVAWVRDASGHEVRAPLDSLGLPVRPALSPDSALVPWFVKRWPASLPSDQPMQLRVAMGDATASTPWLSVLANSIEQQPFAGPGGRAPDPTREEYPDSTVGQPVPEDTTLATRLSPDANATAIEGVRVLTSSPLGAGHVVVFRLDQPGNVRLEVYDLLGRRVATLADRSFAVGAHAIPWEGRDASGARARRGLYFVRMVTPAGTSAAKLLVDR